MRTKKQVTEAIRNICLKPEKKSVIQLKAGVNSRCINARIDSGEIQLVHEEYGVPGATEDRPVQYFQAKERDIYE